MRNDVVFPFERRHIRWLNVIALAAILVLGVWLSFYTIRAEDQQMRNRLLAQTHLVAQTLPLNDLKALKGDSRDEQNPAYHRLKQQLMAAQSIDPHWKWIYLMGRNKEGIVFFQTDSEPYDAPDPSPPGQWYEEASPLLHSVFEKRICAVEGPIGDRWGVWVSAFVPLVDENTGKLLTVVGIDVEANRWRELTFRAGLVPMLLTLAILVVFLAGFYFSALPWPSARIPFLSRHLETAGTLAAGIILTSLGVWGARRMESQFLEEAMAIHSTALSERALFCLQKFQNQQLEGLATFFLGSEEVTEREFRTYVRHLLDVPEVLAWGWAPLVPAREREEFLRQVQSAGMEKFSIWEWDSHGQRIPAAPRLNAYPVHYLETIRSPLRAPIAPGWDLASHPLFLDSALQTKPHPAPFAFELVVPPLQDPAPGQSWILVLHPVKHPRRKQVEGYVLGVIQPQRLLELVQRPFSEARARFSMDLFRLFPQSPPKRLASLSVPGADGDLTHPASVPLAMTRPLLVFGNTYALTLRPSPEMVRAYSFYLGWVVLIAGLALTAAAAILAFYYSQSRENLERMIALRSAELADSLQRYNDLTRQSRIISWAHDAEGLYTRIGGAVEEVLGYTADELVGKKHFYDLHPPEEREQFKKQVFEIMARRESVANLENRMVAKSGAIVWVSTTALPIVNTNGVFKGYHGTDMDITARRRAEEVLRASEEKYRALFEGMLEGMLVLEIRPENFEEPAEYSVVAVNPAFERLVGRKVEELRGRPLREVASHVDSLWLNACRRVALTGAPETFASHFLPDLGKLFEVTLFRPVEGQVASLFNDITERQRADRELRESRRQYAALVANLPGMAYRCRNDRDWTMEFVSDGCRELTGYEPRDLIGNQTISFNELILPAHRERLWDKWQKILAARGQFENEYEIRTRGGEIKWVWERGAGVFDESGQLVALEGFITDITERKRIEIDHERLMRAIEQSTETIVITDANGNILYVNPEFTRTTGYTREEAIGQNPRLVKSGWHDSQFYRHMWQTLLSGQTWEGQLINKRKDGTLFTEHATISPVKDASGKIVHFVAVKRDVTAEIRAQKEKEDLQTQLLHSQKMESIGRLAGGVAHDFNNLLQAILGYLEMAFEQIPPDSPFHSDLKEIQKIALRATTLTRQLQIYARKQIVKPQEINLNECIENMLAMLRPLLGEGIQLVWKPEEQLKPVRMDPGQLDQILANLCLNARDAMPKGGQILIQTANQHLAKADILALHLDLPPGDYVALTVQDTGCGMSPQVLEHIFEPFFTTKASGKGTGLGLAIVYGIIRQQKGTIHVESAPGKGTTFVIYLPAYSGAPTAALLEEETALASAGRETILLVEDEPIILLTTHRMLEALGYRVLPTTSPTEALQLAQIPSQKIDLVITDVVMKEMNGPELINALLQLHPDLKYLYITGYAANLLLEQGGDSSQLNFLQKPFSRATLAKAVQKILRREKHASEAGGKTRGAEG